MGYWGIKSYENDDADDVLDAGFEDVHGDLYEELMDDGNPLSVDQVQKRLADGRTLAAAVAALEEMVGAKLAGPAESWDEAARLGFAGVVVRHAELGVEIPEDLSDTGHRLARARGPRVGRGDQAAPAPREGDLALAPGRGLAVDRTAAATG